MAKNENNFVDINSSSQVNKVFKKKYKKGRGVRIATLLLSILMFIVGSLSIVWYYSPQIAAGYLGGLYNYDEIDKIKYSTSDQTGENKIVAQESLLEDENVLNILLFGQDAVASGSGDHGRSDTLILMSIDNNNKKLKLTSFQRDTYVAIPGYGDGKLNSAFSLGGVPLSIAMIEANFGIAVDKYACVNFDSFRKIVNVIGGVDIELTVDEIQYINAQIDVNNQLKYTSFLEYDPSLEKQMVHLDGYQALWYARNRGCESLGGNPEYTFSGDDWDRTARQRNLLETIMKNLKEDASITELVEIVNAVGPLVTTNLKNDDVAFLVSNAFTYLSYDMVELSLPTQGSWRYGRTDDGQSVIVVTDWDKARYDLASFIYEGKVTSNNQ